MPDGLIIKGNVLEQSPFEVTKQRVFSLKNPFVALSILAHVLLALLLFFIAKNQQLINAEITIKAPAKAIKSYLYNRPPKPAKITKPIATELSLKEATTVVENTALPVKTEQIPVEVKTAEQHSSAQEQPAQHEPAQDPAVKADNQQKNDKPKVLKKETSAFKKAIPSTFSSYNQLKNLRNSIKERIVAEEVAKLQQFRSPSVMHGAQIPVPHSNKQFTAEQIREKNTTKMSDSISITKNDNGTCIIEREQFLGSPVEASRSFFSCGESKFDKSFQEHMKKVQEKIAPKR